ncbi:MAG: YIP1 family protein [Acidiferrobacterales bacterium]|nr:YIP1 family protein [Acidiferrobacterales bacterium]
MTDTNTPESNSPEPASSEPAFNFATVIDDAKKVITNPIGFYREMPTTGGYANPLIFVVVMAAITGLIAAITSLIGLGNAMVAGGMAIASIIILPIFAVIGSFIGAAIMFVIWKLMGSEKNYEAAYRCVAYSFAIGPVVAVLSIIPYLGTIIRSLWTTFLLYAASIEVHKLKAATAKIVFGILAALFVLVGVSSERTARALQDYTDRVSEATADLPSSLQNLENLEDMTAEEAGKAAGEFLKGLEEFSKGLEESINEAEESSE